jgi:integrase
VVTRKGGQRATAPLAPGTGETIDRMLAGRTSLRHTSVTAALDVGASLRDVQDAAGHADPRTTRR